MWEVLIISHIHILLDTGVRDLQVACFKANST